MPFLDQIDQFQNVRVIAQKVTHHQNAGFLAGQPGEIASFVHVQGQRLFDKHVFAGLQRQTDMLAVQGCRRRKRDCVAMGIA